MAGRTYGRISVDIWQDMADAELGRDARQLFPVLVGQKKLSLCGALDLRIKVWAKHTLMNTSEVEAALLELERAGWIAVDWDTDEMVLRGFVKHDLQVNNSKIVLGMWRALDRLESETLREVVLGNLPDSLKTPESGGGTDPEPPPDRPTDRPIDWSIEGSIEGPIDWSGDSPESLNPEPVTTSRLTGLSNAPVENSDDDWINSHAKQHLAAHIAFRSNQIDKPKALARSQLPKIIDTIRDELATGADRYDIDDVLEREWPTIDHAFNPQPSAAVRRVQTAARALKVVS